MSDGYVSPESLGLVIPPFADLPAHLAFKLWRTSGAMLYVSGHIPDIDGEPKIRGRLGAELDVQQGVAAAHRVARNLLSTLRHAADGLENVVAVVKLFGMVASAPDFTDQPAVINGASEVFAAVFGESGLHARSAVGVAQLPFGVPVEIEMVAEIRR